MSHGRVNSVSAAMNRVSVRALVAFAAKTGSLDHRFTPSPSALEGIEGHKKVAQKRSAHYQTEISFQREVDGLLIRGRADGFCPDVQCLEEIKTFYGDYSTIPENHRALHWAQLCMYGWFYCLEHDVKDVRLAVVYFNLSEEKEYRDEQVRNVESLELYCRSLIQRYLLWYKGVAARQVVLAEWLEQCAFPFPELYPSQRQMAEAVYKSVLTGRVLMAEAPTGTGKTLASLFPTLKAMKRKGLDQIYFLTAKSTGKQLALETLSALTTGEHIPLRVIELTAQEKACLEPESLCSGDSCPYAKDFYAKLEQARVAAYQINILDRAALDKLAKEYGICPFYLSMEMCRWADVVVADVNYYFDGSPALLNLVKEEDKSVFLLIDECHNLIDRGRMMYSASLNRYLISAAKKEAPTAIKKSLERINRQWLALLKSVVVISGQLTCIEEIPASFMDALDNFVRCYQEYSQLHAEDMVGFVHIRDCFFEILAFQRIFEQMNDDFCIDIELENGVITLRNLVPAKLLAKRLVEARGASLFSATLNPFHFYHSMLGLPEDAVHLQVQSPFSADQLELLVAHDVSTRYRDRAASISKVANQIKNRVTNFPGNAIAFFSSYSYMQEVERELLRLLEGHRVEMHSQTKNMTEEERAVFLRRFHSQSNILGLAVLGGAFSEGIDLVGDALKGVFIATLGLPQVNEVNEHMRRFLDEKFQQGYEFTYLYPGIQKVIQAAGRVIRTKSDKGYLYLLDERYASYPIRQLLPSWWDSYRSV